MRPTSHVGRARASRPAVRRVVPMGVVLAVTASAGCGAPAGPEPWRLELTAQSPLPGVKRANAISAADFNGDGRVDLAILNGDPGELLVLLNAGEGRFAPSAQGVIAAGRSASGLAAGDVDGDGSADLVISHHDDYEILVLLSQDDGSFQRMPGPAPRSSPGSTPHSHDIALADVNGDSRLDLLQAQSEENAIVVLLGSGAGGFTPAPGSPFAAGRHPYTIVVADFNGDGMPDFAAPNAEGGDLTLGLGDGKGAFTPPGTPGVRLGGRPLLLSAGDVDGDGHVDLVCSFDGTAALRLFLGDGSGAFRSSAAALSARGRCFGQRIVDLDLDGAEDVVAPCIDAAALTVWFGPRGDTANPRSVAFPTPGTDSQILAIADLDDDGLPDAVTAGWDRPTVSVLLGRTATAGTDPGR